MSFLHNPTRRFWQALLGQLFPGRARGQRGRQECRRCQPWLEPLEIRIAPAVLKITAVPTPSVSGDGKYNTTPANYSDYGTDANGNTNAYGAPQITYQRTDGTDTATFAENLTAGFGPFKVQPRWNTSNGSFSDDGSIVIQIQKGPGESTGDPVQLSLDYAYHAVGGTGARVGNKGGQTYVDYSATAQVTGSTPAQKDLFAGKESAKLIKGSPTSQIVDFAPQGSGTWTVNAAVGDTLTITLHYHGKSADWQGGFTGLPRGAVYADFSFSASVATGPYQWTGKGPDNLWSDGKNWLLGAAPKAGKDIDFPASALQQTNVDDLGLAFGAMTVDGGNYKFSGQTLTLNGGADFQGGTTEFDNSITTGAPTTIEAGATVTVGAGATLNILSTDDFNVAQGGNLNLFGPCDAAGAVTVNAGANLNVAPTGSFTCEATSTVAYNGKETFADGSNLYLNAGANVSLLGTLDSSGTITANAKSDFAVQAGGLLKIGKTLTLDGKLDCTGEADLESGAQLNASGTGSLICEAKGHFNYAGKGDFGDGTLTVNADGVFDLLTNARFTTSGPTTVNAQGSYHVHTDATYTQNGGNFAAKGKVDIDSGGTELLQAGVKATQSDGSALTVNGTLDVQHSVYDVETAFGSPTSYVALGAQGHMNVTGSDSKLILGAGTKFEAGGGSVTLNSSFLFDRGFWSGTVSVTDYFHSIVVEPGGTLDLTGSLTEAGGGSLDNFGTLIVEPGSTLSDTGGAITIEPGSAFNAQGTVTGTVTYPAPTVTSPAATLTVATGTFNITGVAQAGSTVTLYSDPNLSGSVSGNGVTQVSSQTAGPDGSYSFTVQLTAGATSHFFVTGSAGGSPSAPTLVPALTRVPVKAVWVNTDEITGPGARQNLVSQAAADGVNTIYISVYQSTPNGAGRYMYDDANLAALIGLAHAAGIQVWADYGAPDWPALGTAPSSFPMQRLAEVVAYNQANPSATFDGVMLDVEFAYDSTNSASYDTQESTFLGQLVPLYQAAQNLLTPAGVQVGAAISAFWNPNELTSSADQAAVTITVGSVTAPAYQQVIALGLSQVVVMGYRDFPGAIPPTEGEDGIVGLDQDEIQFAASTHSKTAIVAGLETQNLTPATSTFYGDGSAVMNGVMQTVTGYFGGGLGGFAVDGYGNSYLSGQAGWPSSGPIAPTVTGVAPALGFDQGGTTVTITGTNLGAMTGASAATVYFGGTAGKLVSDNGTTIVAVAPAGADGTVDVTVQTEGGTSPTGPADQFTYVTGQTLALNTPTVVTVPASGKLGLDFTATAGQELYFNSLTTSYLYWQVTAPDGSFASFGSGNGLAVLPLTGIYQITLFSYSPTATQAAFQLLDAALQPVLSFNQSISGTLPLATGPAHPTGVTQLYQVPATAGQQLVFHDLSVSATSSALWTLYDPTGHPVASTQNLEQDLTAITSTSGTYLLTIDNPTTQSVSYSFNAQATPVPTVAPGTIYTQSIAANGQATFVFNGSAGQELYYNALDGSVPVSVQILGPDGSDLSDFNAGDNQGPIVLPQAGLYQFIFANSDSSAKEVSFQLLDAAAQPTLTLGQTVSGTLGLNPNAANPVGESQLYQISATAGTRLVFHDVSVSPDGVAKWTLYDPTGQQVNFPTDLGVDFIAPITTTGQYLLVLDNPSNAAVSFSVQIEAAAVSQNTTQIGATVTGAIATEGEQQVYTFTGAAGQRIVLNSLSNTLPNPTLDLTDPTGASVFSRGFNTGYLELATLPSTGTYQLTVGDRGTGTGTYTFSIVDDTTLPALTPGTSVSGTLQAPVSSQYVQQALVYQLTASAGDRISLASQSPADPNGETYWEVLGPDNTFVSGASGTIDQSIQFTAPASGEYLVELDTSSQTSVPYQFTEYDNIQPQTGSFNIGDTVNGAISIPGQAAIYTFTGSAGQYLHFDSIGSPVSPLTVQIVSPSGNEIFFGSTYDNDVVVLPEAGTYQMTIAGVDAATATYSFRLSDVSTSPMLSIGTETTGTIPLGYGSSFYLLQGTAGERVLLHNLSTSSLSGMWALYAPDGTNVSKFTDLQSDFTATLPVTGTYLLALSDSSGQPQAYDFIATNPPTNTSSLTLGAAVTGNIAAAGQEDVYTFTGSAGQTLFYDGLDQSSRNGTMELVAPDGTVLDYDLAQNKSAPLVLPASGTYQLVMGATDTNTGHYAFRLLDVAAQPELPRNTYVPANVTTLPGVPDPVIEDQVFRIAGSAGETLNFDHRALFSSDSLAYYKWSLFDPTGQPIDFPSQYFGSLPALSNGGDATIVLPTTGEYTVVIDPSGIGSYHFGLSSGAPAAMTLTSVDDPITPANQASAKVAGITFAGAAVTVVATDGVHTTSPVQVTADSSGAWSATLNVKGLMDGAVVYRVSASDSSGDSASAAWQATKDTVAQVAFTAVTDPIVDTDRYNVPVSGTAQPGAQISVVATIGTYTTPAATATADATGSWSVVLNTSGLIDGTVTYQATATDNAGNTATVQEQVTRQTVAPVTLVVTPDPITAASATSVTVSGSAANGTVVQVTATDGSITTNPVAATASNGSWSVHLDVSSLPDGWLKFAAAATDPAGNTGSATQQVAKQTGALTLTAVTDPVNAGNQTSVTVSGAAPDGTAITVMAFDSGNTASAAPVTASGGTWTATLDVSGLNDGPITYVATATDSQGNNVQVERQGFKATGTEIALVAVTDPVTAANQTAVVVSGSAGAGAPVNVQASDGTNVVGVNTTADNSGQWSATMDLSSLTDGPISIQATASAIAGLDAIALGQTVKDTVAQVRLTAAPALVTTANETQIVLTGSAADGTAISVTADDGTTTTAAVTTTASGGAWSVALDVHALSDGPITYTVNATDPAGSTAMLVRQALKDTQGALALIGGTGPITLVDDAAVSVLGIAQAGATVQVTATDGTTTTPTTTATADANGLWFAVLDTSGLADGTITYQATATDAAGDTATVTQQVVKATVLPTITQQPTDQTAAAGSTVTFTAVVSGPGTITCQWQSSYDGVTFNDIPNAKSPSYSFTASPYASGVTYRAIFTNTAGSVTTNVVLVTVSAASPTITVTDSGGPYTGQPYSATGSATSNGTTVNGSFSYTYTDSNGNTLADAPTNAGTYTVVASFTSDDPNFSDGQSAPVPFTITPATPSVTVTDAGGAYIGQAYTATGSATGNGNSVNGTFAYTFTDSHGNTLAGAPVNAGSYSVVAAFTSSDPNYAGGQSTPLGFTISPAAPTVTASDNGGTYNGNPFAATGSATGVAGSSVSGTYTFAYTDAHGNTSANAPVNAGSYSVVTSFASTDPNYANGKSAAVNFTISPATPAVTVSDAAGPYNGEPYAAAGAATANGASVNGTFSYRYADSSGHVLAGAPSNAGNYTVVASFTSSDPNYANAQSQPTAFTITPATPNLAVSARGGPYTGSAYAALVTASGVGGAAVNGSFSLAYSDQAGHPLLGAPTLPGSYLVVTTFASTDPNYAGAVSQPTSLNITAGPSGSIASDTPSFAWMPTAGADHYALQITHGKSVVLTIAKVTATAYTLTAAQTLTPGQSYGWNVTALSATGKALGAPTTATFQVLSLAAPALSGPTGSITTDRPMFAWTPAAGHAVANRYTLQLTDTLTKSVVTIANLTGTTYTLTAAQALTPGHGYTWSVTAVSTNGKVTATSSSDTLQVLPLGAPSPANPVGASATDLPTFAWTAATDPAHTAPASFILKITDTKTAQAINLNVTGTSDTLTTAQALTPGHSYIWSVTAVSTNGKVSVASSTTTFQVLPIGTPTLQGPTGTSSTDRPTFTWTAPTDAQHTAPAAFLLKVADKAGGQSLTIRVAGDSYTLTAAQALTPGHTYTWSVTALSTNGKATASSPNATFAIAALAAPTGLSWTSASDTFGWQGVPNAGGYNLVVLDTASGSSVLNVRNIAGTSYQLTAAQTRALRPGRSYTWYVIAVSTNGKSSARSASTQFTM